MIEIKITHKEALTTQRPASEVKDTQMEVLLTHT